jgi:hypothetical protein
MIFNDLNYLILNISYITSHKSIFILLGRKKIKKIQSLTNPPISRNNHTSMILKNSLIIYGGWDGTKTLNDMYEMSLSNLLNRYFS